MKMITRKLSSIRTDEGWKKNKFPTRATITTTVAAAVATTTVTITYRAPIVTTWADQFSPCCWRQFSRFLACPNNPTPVPASHCLSSLLHAASAA